MIYNIDWEILDLTNVKILIDHQCIKDNILRSIIEFDTKINIRHISYNLEQLRTNKYLILNITNLLIENNAQFMDEVFKYLNDVCPNLYEGFFGVEFIIVGSIQNTIGINYYRYKFIRLLN